MLMLIMYYAVAVVVIDDDDFVDNYYQQIDNLDLENVVVVDLILISFSVILD